MHGLENEWTRFAATCLQEGDEDAEKSLRLIFMAGAAAASNRIFCVLTSNLSPARQSALIRRIAREMLDFQNQIATNALLHEPQDG